jgi:glycosyltransferase involved in cell wall biosynthesis
LNEGLCTVVVCSKNSERTLLDCLTSLENYTSCRKILVDGFSTDLTRQIAANFTIEIVDGSGIGLTADRQIGIELSQTEYTIFVDSDHIVSEHFIDELLDSIQSTGSVLVQSRLELDSPKGILNRGENVYYTLVHNNATEKIIPGIAPAIFRTSLFKRGNPLEIDDGKTKTIEDTNWAHKATRLGFKVSIDGPIVWQKHEAGLRAYVNKFYWYGLGDAEFCLSNSFVQLVKHLFHLGVRYPFLYTIRAMYFRKFEAIPFLMSQGLIRFGVCVFYCFKNKKQKSG